MTAAASVDIAEELGIRPASPGVRSLAFVIDLLVWLLLASPAAVGLWLFLHHGLGRWQIVLLAGGSVLVSAFCVVQIALHGRRGVTLGKAAMKLRSVSMPGLSRPGFWRIVLRSLVLSVSNVIPIAGPVLLFSSSYWDSSGRRRNMLDRAGSCWLIDVSEGIDPTDTNALRRARRNYESRFRDISEHLPPFSFRSARSAASIIGAAPERWETQSGHTDRGMALTGGIAASWVFVFDDATSLAVTSFGLMGRAPQQIEGRNIAQLISLHDPNRMLSKTHLAFGADEHGVWVEDLGSSNGTEVQLPGERTALNLDPGAPVRMGEGAIVQVGSRKFRVQREEARA